MRALDGRCLTDRLWETGDVVNVLEGRENNTRKITLSFPSKVYHRHRLLASRPLSASAPAFKEDAMSEFNVQKYALMCRRLAAEC